MKVSEVQPVDLAEFMRLDDYREDEMQRILDSAKAYIRDYTGLTDEEVDTHADFLAALLVLCQDMNDNRSMYVDKSNVNRVVESILNMHRVNLL